MADSPDIRVRLSAEGVEEVIRALKSVQDQAKRSGQGFKVLNDAMGDLQGLVGGLGLAAVVTGMVSMTKRALESADAVGKLQQKTGISTQTLSALRVQAELADASFEDMAKGLQKFNKTMGELDQGSAQAGDAVRRLFGSAQALNGLNTEERFKRVAEAIGKMPAGFQKTKAAMDFFGRSGAELIPLLDDLSNGGMQRAMDKAKKLGLVIDEDLAKSAQKANDNIKELGLAAQGAATQFAAGLAPALADSASALNEAFTGAGVNGLQVLGQAVGAVARGIVGAFLIVGKSIGGFIAEGVEGAIGAFDALKLAASATGALIKGDAKSAKQGFDAAWKSLGETASRMKAIGQSTDQDVFSSLWNLWNPKEEPANTKTNGKGAGGGPQDAAAAKAYTELLKARLESELNLFLKAEGLAEQHMKTLYDQGLVSLGEYYNQRRALIEAESDKEIQTLQEKRKLAGKTVTSNAAEEIAKKKEIEGLDSQIAAKGIERRSKLAALDDEERKKTEELAKRKLDIESQIQQVEGKTYEAALAHIQAQADELRKQGVDPATVDRLTTALTNQAKFQSVQKAGSDATAALDTAKAGLDNQVAAGALFPFQALEQYQAQVRAAIPDLMALAEAQRAAAVTPEEILAAEQFKNQIDALAISADKDAQQMAQFKQAVENSLTSNLTTFFTTGIEQAENFGDAMRGLALSVVDSLRQIAAQMLATYAAQQLLKFATSVGFSGGGQVHAADGGFISGPGTGTSDSIPAMLSDGEFVVRSAVVSQPGMLEHLSAINRGIGPMSVRSRGGVPRFADGGLVTASDALRSGVSVEANFGLEEGVLMRNMKAFMRSPDGQRIQIETLGANRKRASSALGGGR